VILTIVFAVVLINVAVLLVALRKARRAEAADRMGRAFCDPAKTAGGYGMGAWASYGQQTGGWGELGGCGDNLYPRTYTLADIDAVYRAEQGEEAVRGERLP
jgi:hypothetical protein